MTQDQVDELFADCMGEENDDGEIDYIRKCFEIESGSIPTLYLEFSNVIAACA